MNDRKRHVNKRDSVKQYRREASRTDRLNTMRPSQVMRRGGIRL